MRKHLLTLVFAASAALANAGEVTLKVSGPDGLTGTATMVNKVQEDGTKYVRLSMKLTYGNGQTSDVLQESSYSTSGEPVRMLQRATAAGKKSSVVVTFTDEGAQVVVDKGDGPSTNLVVRPDGSVANPTEFWFCKTKPKAGATVEFFTFRVSEQAWAKVKARYEGAKEIVVAGKRVTANLIQMGEIKAYVDDKGDPLRIEFGTLTMERNAP